ncbi:MAG: hypothetical protein E4G90_07565, partial [Gemmatimonadales bacterium]
MPFITEDTHLGHPDTDTDFFVRLPGQWDDNDTGSIAFSDASDRVTWTAHGLPAGTEVIFSEDGGTLPTNIVPGVVYYVLNPDTNDFQISISPGGAALDFGSNGSGTILYALAGSIFEIPHFFTETEILELGFAQSLDVMTLTHVNRPAWELRRRGPTDWVVGEVAFNNLPAPANVVVTPRFGFGIDVASVTAATPAVITLAEPHSLGAAGTYVVGFVQDVADIPDGLYQLAPVVDTVQMEVLTLEGRDEVTSSVTTLGANPRIFPADGGQAEDAVQTYVVTALDAVGNESPRSAEVEVTNFILAQGAFNTVTWDAVAGATRYRVYKKEVGILAFIGAVEATDPLTLKDDNIGPDGALTAPIVDDSLREVEIVTFDTTNHRVLWSSHGFQAGTPIVFRSTGTLPTALIPYSTYFVLNPRTDSFEVTDDTGLMLAMTGVDVEEIHEATAGTFPASVAYFEQRRVFAGSLIARRTMWMTRTGTEADMTYRIPTVASDRISAPVAARLGDSIRHIVPLSQLMILSNATEYRVTPINDDAITPDSISVRPESFVSASKATPEVVNNVGIAAAARGGHVREFGFQRQVVSSYITGDLSIRTPDLFDGFTIDQIAYSKAPLPIVWFASSSGQGLALTYAPEEQIGSWAHMVTAGTIESVASVPEDMEDHLYLMVNRAGVRQVERMGALDFGGAIEDARFVDNGVAYDGAPTTAIWAPHLEGQSVVALADGLAVTGLTVTGGYATLPTPASKVALGLAYTARIEGLPLYMAIPGLGGDRQKNVNAVRVRVVDS